MTNIRTARDSDFPLIVELVERDPLIVRHTSYTYWLLKTMSPDAMLVCSTDQHVHGFLAGIVPFKRPEQSFLLQVTVAASHRRQRIGTTLVTEFISRSRVRGCERILLTINPSNTVSELFFESAANANNLTFSVIGKTGDLGGILEEERLWELAPPAV